MRKYTIELDEFDLGQVIDGLEVRAAAWEKAAAFYRRGQADVAIEVSGRGRGRQNCRALSIRYREDSESAGGAIMSEKKLRNGFCIYINTFCQGAVPVVSDETGYIVFDTEMEAQREIVDNLMTRLQQFLDGERDYEDAITVEEYVVPVTLQPDGTITDADGNCFGPHPE